ncbi:DNA mismatch repair protein [Vibrio sp. SM6]|uniref:DNA mismatch repair protein n=1 Tax=Vibrio agarilyticus TaxID=2726741 RepID=A0A7X8TNT8_9VIBR|nr:DNA mismatch repair protein [Vibrio agarilyticus]NLS12170.1 DNA mismatch repair protein [Vibrio agarilyticus]
MTRIRSWRLPPPWALVLLGLVLNIVSLLLSSVILDGLNEQLARSSLTKEQNRRAIELDWSQVDTLERKREMALIYVSIHEVSRAGDGKVANDAAVISQLARWLNVDKAQLSLDELPTILNKIDDAQQGLRDRIDDYYFANIELSERMIGIEQHATTIKNWALFLQLFGLALILSRDLSR